MSKAALFSYRPKALGFIGFIGGFGLHCNGEPIFLNEVAFQLFKTELIFFKLDSNAVEFYKLTA